MMTMMIRNAAILVALAAAAASAEQVANWQAYLEPHPFQPDTKYSLVFEWDHIHADTIFVDGENGGRVYNAEDDERCNGDSSVVATDGQPFWMPRFFPRPVSEEITAVTGVKFASADWQPCGHKEITICHAESHYDFHMYYESEEDMNALPMCEIGVPSNPDLPVCQDSVDVKANHDYFRLINHSIPQSLKQSSPEGVIVDSQKNFCVDATSAVVRSGVHYGDASETLDEWKTPVTIIGSHDCEIKFFEPMFSWKWVSGCVNPTETSWPVFAVEDIQYTKKGIESLPDSWKVEVSEACRATNCFPGEMDPPTSEVCHIKLTAQGDKCPEGGCTLLKECGNIEDCTTGQPYVSPWQGSDEEEVVETPVACVGATQECDESEDCCPGLSCQRRVLNGRRYCTNDVEAVPEETNGNSGGSEDNDAVEATDDPGAPEETNGNSAAIAHSVTSMLVAYAFFTMNLL